MRVRFLPPEPGDVDYRKVGWPSTSEARVRIPPSPPRPRRRRNAKHGKPTRAPSCRRLATRTPGPQPGDRGFESRRQYQPPKNGRNPPCKRANGVRLPTAAPTEGWQRGLMRPVGSRVGSDTPASSNLAPPASPGSPIGRGRRLKPCELWVRPPPRSPGSLAQLAEAPASNPGRSEFESRGSYHVRACVAGRGCARAGTSGPRHRASSSGRTAGLEPANGGPNPPARASGERCSGEHGAANVGLHPASNSVRAGFDSPISASRGRGGTGIRTGLRSPPG